jgi:hypothetical protein
LPQDNAARAGCKLVEGYYDGLGIEHIADRDHSAGNLRRMLRIIGADTERHVQPFGGDDRPSGIERVAKQAGAPGDRKRRLKTIEITMRDRHENLRLA